MKKIIILVSSFLFLNAGVLFAEGLSTIKEADKAFSENRKALEAETAIYENVSSALANDSFEKGMTKDAVREAYGEPVIISTDPETGTEKWVYKPGSSTMFKGPKIYIYFDEFGSLTKTKSFE